MPEVDVAAEIRGDVQIEQTVAVVVEPDRAVAVHPAMQAGRLGHVLEMRAVDVPVQREIPVAIDEEILTTVVVEVAPDAAHRHAVARPIQVSDARGGADVLERAVTLVPVQRVRRTESAVREVEIRPAIAIEVADRHGGAERGDMRLDVRDLRVEGGPAVNERDPRGLGLVPKDESGM